MNERENALKELINLEKESQHKISFYEYGTFSNPGISDLDLICEVSEDYEYIKGFSKDKLSHEIRSAMAHASLICVPKGMIHTLHLWDDIKMRSVRDNVLVYDIYMNYRLRDIAMFIDFYYERRFRILAYNENLALLTNHRQGLGFCKSYCYSISSYLEFAGECSNTLRESGTKLVESINKYRKASQDKEYKEYADILVKCLKAISNFEARHGNEIDESINRIISNHIKVEKDSIDASIKIRNGPSYHTSKVGKNGKYSAKIPSGAALQYALYASFDMNLSRKFRESFEIYPQMHFDIQSEYVSFLYSRFAVADKWHEFASKTKHKCGIYKFGWLK